MTCEKLDSDFSATILAMIVPLRHFLGWLVSAFHSREDLILENLALRRQLLALHAQQPRRRLTALHKLFWVALKLSRLTLYANSVYPELYANGVPATGWNSSKCRSSLARSPVI